MRRGASKIPAYQVIQRHLAAGQLLSHMFFPDDAERCRANEIIFRAKFADWWSAQVAQLEREELKRRILLGPPSGVPTLVPRRIDDPYAWTRNWIFETYLCPFGGTIGAVLALKDLPSEQALEEDRLRRWFGVVYAGRLTLLIGSTDRHTLRGGSLNKAIYVMLETDGNNNEIQTLAKQLNCASIYESSLKKAWRIYKPVAHLCAAYVLTELQYSGAKFFKDIFRDFASHCQHPALLEQFTAFSMYCTFGRYIEEFLTSFRPHGQREPLVSTEEIYSLERNLGLKSVFALSFPPLTEEEIATLERYRAPKSFV